MDEFLEMTLDKFTFRVATDRLYSSQGVWAKVESETVRIGLSDFLQQRSGDVAFAELKPPETHVAAGEEIAVIETIKVNISLDAPVSGTILEVNAMMATSPELINQDPYGEGWLALIKPSSWDADRTRLMDAQAYFELMQQQAKEESS